MGAPAASSGSPSMVKFVLDCTQVHKDHILDPQNVQTFLSSRIKVDNKTSNFVKTQKKTDKTEHLVIVTCEGSTVVIQSQAGLLKKRYIKYLTKKYLATQQIRDFLRVISTSPTTYTLKYFAAAKADEEA